METQKSNELRVRLRRVKSATGKQRCDLAAVSSTIHSSRLEGKSDTRKDDFATAHFKLTAALEAAAAQASGFNFNWCNTKRNSAADDAMKESKKKLEGLIARRIQKIVQGPKLEKDGIEEAQAAGFIELIISTPLGSSCPSDDDEDVEQQEDGCTNIFTSARCDDASNTCTQPESPNAKDKHERSPCKMEALLVAQDSSSSDIVGCCNKQSAAAGVPSILELPPFDPCAPQLKVQLIIKKIVSLAQLKQRIVDSSKGAISKSGPIPECEVVAEMEFANIRVKHDLDEFLTFCSCKNCLVYREIVVHLMVDQFKAQHMVVMLVNALIKAYSPMLKNATAHKKFEKLLDANREIYWMTCGYIFNKMVEHMSFIYDETLSDNMILVLFSAILLVNNPLLLLQILSFHVTCIVKAYAEGFMEIVDPDNNKFPAEEMLTYILDGYDDLCRISENITCYLFAFENDFLQKFLLTWTFLCQRLYQQHVYLNLTDTMLACIITLKEDVLNSRHSALIKKYIRFDDKMLSIDKRWTIIWMELNKFILSEGERKRRALLMDVYRIFDVVVQDAIELSLRESCDDNDFYDFQNLENRQLAWQNIMAYMKMKCPDGFFEPPNNEVCEAKCKKCNVLLEYHADSCKCITCSIAGGPTPPKRNPDNTCYKCLALQLVEKEVTFYESKILNACASDDFLSFVKNNEKRKRNTLEEFRVDISSSMAAESNSALNDHQDLDADDDDHGTYHLAWAVFKHLNNRKRFKHSSIEAKYFCNDCELQACHLARKILNNEIALALSLHLIRYYQPFTMSRDELRSVLPNIMLYNRKMISSNFGLDLNEVHDLVLKIYWTFVISIYATYFIEFDSSCPLHLDNFVLANNDIKLCTENLIGNKDDNNFVLFLDKIKGMENSEDDNTDEIKKKLEDILKICERTDHPPLLEKNPSTESSSSTSGTTGTTENSNKKNCKDKQKKCCFDHPDFGDHCKENHSSKKRIKKECNHARMNETRDRLRKKLSQLVNARKNMKTIVDKQTAASQQTTKLNASAKLDTVEVEAPATKEAKLEPDDDSLECLNTLCKRISHLSTGPSEVEEEASATVTNSTKNTKPNAPSIPSSCHSSAKKSNANASISEGPNGRIHANKPTPAPLTQTLEKRSSSNATTFSSTTTNGSSSTSTKKSNNGLDMVNEIYELLGSYSKDQSKVKKWINETLSYIEGSNGGCNGKQQPQPTNAKKAAKKAKQKQRKEEEKRIAELKDLRNQFHDLYFKEFMDKHELKVSKSSKKRDKKKIAELETNIKKLQRAKAKVETAILELIATVKQSNTEFKFSYLPTKEQQQDKLKQFNCVGDAIEEAKNKSTILTNEDTQQSQPFVIPFPSNSTNHELKTSNIASRSYSLPYAHANNFPCHRIGMQTGIATTPPPPFGSMIHPSPTPMCYAPPTRPQLSQDVVAAMAANAACNSSTDPSKRIVTIRRVNLPNVPEPQVTVTAKGSSPDKDKLLYTFVNGQLLQNGTSLPPVAQIPRIPLQMPNVAANLANSHQVNSAPPLPAPPPLSKTQRKKERRRLARKLAEDDAKAVIKSVGPKSLENIETKKLEPAAIETNKEAKARESNVDRKPKVPETDIKTSVSKVKKKKKPTIKSSPSETSILTAEAVDILAPSTYSASSSQRRSPSSHSAAIPSSGVSTSSQINTRDNSISSQKPKGTPVQNNSQQKQEKRKVNKKLSTASPSTATPHPPPPPTVIQEIETTRPTEAASSNSQKKNVKRRKFIDNGQFDNNPFKSLHMQDLSSDSEMCSSSSAADECDVTPSVYKIIKLQPNNKPIDSSQIPQKSVRSKQKKEQTKSDSLEKVGSSKQENKIKHQNKFSMSQQTTLSTNALNDKRNEISSVVNSQTLSRNVRTPRVTRSSKKSSHQEEKVKEMAVPSALAKDQQRRRIKNGTTQHDTPQSHSLTNKIDQSSRFERTHNQRQTIDTSGKDQVMVVGEHKNSVTARNCTRAAPASDHSMNISSEASSTKPLSKRALKQAQRNKHKTQKQQISSDLYAGIPNNMGYFNPSDFTVPSPQIKQQQNQFHQLKQCQQQQYKTIQQQMQNLWIDSSHQQQQQHQQQQHQHRQHQQKNGQQNSLLMSAVNPTHRSFPVESNIENLHVNNPSNVSIMDQLNRGVQVENLSLPPGITLTKVDPVKSELLRKKSESIKKLAKPFHQQQQQQHQSLTQSFHSGATIIAPPITPVSRYYGIPYAGVAAAAALGQNGGAGNVIMLETLSSSNSATANHQEMKLNAAAAVSETATKSKSKNRKRRNKSKLVNNSKQSGNNASETDQVTANGQPKMITLRNPMFHNGSSAPATNMLQQSSLIAGRSVAGLPVAAPLPMDQPASIIKNENGMFTIRNPALQQAVANGLAMGGYRQFGNVNYYTPQEAVAEASRANPKQSTAKATAVHPSPSSEISTFSYFSNSSMSEISPSLRQNNEEAIIRCLENVGGGTDSVRSDATVNNSCHEYPRNARHNNITGMNCAREINCVNNSLNGDAAVIARPLQSGTGKCISAIGSEMKNAQQQKQKSEHQWINFGQELSNSVSSSDAMSGSNSSYLGANACGAITSSPVQDKYQQSNYYNGFVDVFPANCNSNQMSIRGGRSSNAGSLFDNSDCHMNHNCDDSPPPTITGFNHYLEGIPNTGVIRYDDATFLKTLMPGQNLNNEVSIHNINEANFARNNTSPLAHRVEISPVYANRPNSENMYEHCSNPSSNYRNSLSEYGNGGNIFVPNNLINITELETVNRDVDSFKQFNYEFEQENNEKRKVHMNLGDLLMNNKASSSSNRTSPYMDENTLDTFVQNINKLQLSPTVVPAADEQSSSQLSSGGTGNGNGTNSKCAANGGWW